ncbi:hypothetical protein ACOSQ4_014211 [Xanthoceras sorbifolium]
MVDHASKIVVESDDPENLTSNWEFALLDLAGSHYAAICVDKDKSTGGEATIPMRLTAWKTIPFIEDERVTRTDAVQAIGGLIKQSCQVFRDIQSNRRLLQFYMHIPRLHNLTYFTSVVICICYAEP